MSAPWPGQDGQPNGTRRRPPPVLSQDSANTTPFARRKPTSTGLGVHPLGKRYMVFHNKRHPAEMGAPEIEAFLTHLAVKEKGAAST